MKVLITGGCGYLGGSLVKHLNEHHPEIEEIRIYDNLSRGDMAFLFKQDINQVKVKLYHHDILDRKNLLEAMKGVEVIVHMAAKIVNPYTDIDLHLFDQINNWGTSNVADAIQDSDVKKAIYLSSMTVYGSHDQIVDESSTPEPQTSYGRSKLKGEKHFQRLDGKEVVIMRCANAFGYSPTMRVDSVFNRFMFEAHFTRRVNRIGDGNQVRSFIELESFCKQMSHAIVEDNEPGIYDLADANYSINDVLELFHDLFPDLEVITIEQNSTLRSVQAKLPTKMARLVGHELRDIQKVLEDFKDSFSF